MSFWDFPRRPALHSVEEQFEAERSAPAAARRHLEQLDDEFVDRAFRLGIHSGVVLDIASGIGQIPLRLAARSEGLLIHVIHTSAQILGTAALDAVKWRVEMRIFCNIWTGAQLPYDSGLFDLVLCDGHLHHADDPVSLIREMARVCKPEGGLLLRDFIRPGRLSFTAWVKRHGRNYEGRMLELFKESIRSCYTLGELRNLVSQSGVAGLAIGRMGPAHIGFRRLGEHGTFH